MDLAIKEALLLRSKECNKLDDFIPYLKDVHPMLEHADLTSITDSMLALFLPNFGGMNHDPSQPTMERVVKLLAFWKDKRPLDHTAYLSDILKYGSKGELNFENYYKHTQLLMYASKVYHEEQEEERLEAFFLMLWKMVWMPELAATDLLEVMIQTIENL